MKYKHPNLNLNTILNLKFGLKPLTALCEDQTSCCLWNKCSGPHYVANKMNTPYTCYIGRKNLGKHTEN